MTQTGLSLPHDLEIPNPSESPSLFVPTGDPAGGSGKGSHPEDNGRGGAGADTRTMGPPPPPCLARFRPFWAWAAGVLEQRWEGRGDQEPEPPCRAWADAVPSPGTCLGPLPQLLS